MILLVFVIYSTFYPSSLEEVMCNLHKVLHWQQWIWAFFGWMESRKMRGRNVDLTSSLSVGDVNHQVEESEELHQSCHPHLVSHWDQQIWRNVGLMFSNHQSMFRQSMSLF